MRDSLELQALGHGPLFLSWQQRGSGASDVPWVASGLAAVVADGQADAARIHPDAWENHVALFVGGLLHGLLASSRQREGAVGRLSLAMPGGGEGFSLQACRTAIPRLPPVPMPRGGAAAATDDAAEGTVAMRSPLEVPYQGSLNPSRFPPEAHHSLARHLLGFFGEGWSDASVPAALLGGGFLLLWQAMARLGAVSAGHVFRDIRPAGQPAGRGDTLRLTLMRTGAAIDDARARAHDGGYLLLPHGFAAATAA